MKLILLLFFLIANGYLAFERENKALKIAHLLATILCMVRLVGEIS